MQPLHKLLAIEGPQPTHTRCAELRAALESTEAFRERTIPVDPTEEFAEVAFMLRCELSRPVLRRSILKALHGRACRLRQRLEWQAAERALRAAS